MKRTLIAAGLLTAVLGFAPLAAAAPVTLTLASPSATFLFPGTAGCPDCSASVDVTLGFDAANLVDELRFDFANGSTDGLAGVNILTAFGFNTSPELTFGTPSWSSISGGKTWSWGTQGLGKIDFGAVANSGVTNGLDGGQSGSVVLPLLSPQTDAITFDSSLVHIQALANGQSIKLTGCNAADEACTTQEVPEPATMFLLGGGLLAAGFLVRKKK